MTQEELERLKCIDRQIETIREAAQELKKVSGGLPAVDRNTDRILASTKMLEINVSDVLKLL